MIADLLSRVVALVLASVAPAGPIPARCPPAVPECRETEGRIVYVERVDPDGDGDAHST